MIQEYLINTVRVIIGNINELCDDRIVSRSEREVSAVMKLLRHAFGADAVICLTHSDSGAPRMTVDGETWNISISHSRERACIALDRHHKIGIDLEEWRDQLLKVRSKYLTPDEDVEWGVSHDKLLQAWMAKEAAFKAMEPKGISLLSISLHTHEADFAGSRAALFFRDGFVLAILGD